MTEDSLLLIPIICGLPSFLWHSDFAFDPEPHLNPYLKKILTLFMCVIDGNVNRLNVVDLPSLPYLDYLCENLLPSLFFQTPLQLSLWACGCSVWADQYAGSAPTGPPPPPADMLCH